MADLSKIQRGDKLKLEVEVLRVCGADTKSGWQVEVRTVSRRSACGFLSGGLAENAEHIPAPRVFKRGDWVKLHGEEAPNQGLVVAEIPKGPTRQTGALYTVNWPNGGYFEYLADDLEPDEAPE
jgi:hypothetical protein